jgi:hypothetical protein
VGGEVDSGVGGCRSGSGEGVWVGVGVGGRGAGWSKFLFFVIGNSKNALNLLCIAQGFLYLFKCFLLHNSILKKETIIM